MSEFFDSLKADLLDRRLIPLLALLGLALLGAIAYASFAGGSTAAQPSASAPVTTPKTAGIDATAVSSDTKTPVAETTSGATQQTGGSSRNPFSPTPGVKAKPAAGSAAEASKAGSAAGSGSSAGSTSGSSAGGSEAGGAETQSGAGSESGSSSQQGTTTTPTEQKKSSKQSKPKVVYHVSVLFGTAAPATPVASAGLTPFEKLTRQQPLPSAQQPLIVFRGVLAGGKSAAFTLVGESILRGDAKCLPSASQCEAIDLKPGQVEELEYVPLGGSAVTYELQLVSITSKEAKASVAQRVFGHESKSGVALLRNEGLTGLAGLRYSASEGVLVLAEQHPLAAGAHVSAWLAGLKG